MDLREKIKNEAYREMVSKAICNFAFRSGPIEDYHADGTAIGDKEMEKINRYMHNTISCFLCLLSDGQDEVLGKFCEFNALYTSYFDRADFNAKESQEMLKICELIAQQLKLNNE